MSAARQTGAPNPLALSIDPRERLLVVDIGGDPQFAALELQVFDDAARGRGMLVLLERRDGLVDYYRQPGLRLDRAAFSVGRGMGRWEIAEIDPAVFEIAADGVAVDVSFTDAVGRTVELRLDDCDGQVRQRASLLAPVGAGVERPLSLFVVVMLDFDLVRTSGPEPHLSIGGQRRKAGPFAGAWLHRRRMIRYSAQPIIAVLNPQHEGPLQTAGPNDGIAELHAGAGVRAATLRLSPPLPNVIGLVAGERRTGRWLLDVADQQPLIGGTWAAERTGDVVQLAMDVTQPWRPRQRLPLLMRIVTTVARVFRIWPTTYRWHGRIELRSEPPRLSSRWTRTSRARSR